MEVLKLLSDNKTLRRMYYAALIVFVVYALSPVLVALVNNIAG